MNIPYNPMLYNKKYIIRIPKDTTNLLIFGVAVAFIALRTIVPFLYGVQALFIFYMGIKAYYNANRLFTHQYVIVYTLFLLWCFISFLWSLAMDKAVGATISIGQMVMICSLMTLYLVSLENIDKVLYGFALASLVMMVFLIIKTPQGEWINAITGSFSASSDKGRIGYSIGHHPNAMGNLCALLAYLWLYLYDKSKRKIYFLWIFLLSIILLFTKSRAAILMMVMYYFGYLFLRKKRRFAFMKLIPTIILLSFILYWVIFNVPILYELIGFRIEGMLGIFNSSYNLDASSHTRLNMIRYGFDMFIKRPLTGVGFGNYGYYAYRYYDLFTETYAHNNYIEIMAGLGIIGVLLYYILPICSCIILGLYLKRVNEDRRKLCAFLFVAIVVRLITDFVKITYNDELTQMINVICICGANIMTKMQKASG